MKRRREEWAGHGGAGVGVKEATLRRSKAQASVSTVSDEDAAYLLTAGHDAGPKWWSRSE